MTSAAVGPVCGKGAQDSTCEHVISNSVCADYVGMWQTLCKVEALAALADRERRALEQLDVLLELARNVDVPVVREVAQRLQQAGKPARGVLGLL